MTIERFVSLVYYLAYNPISNYNVIQTFQGIQYTLLIYVELV